MLAHLARMRGPLHYTRKFHKAGASKLILDKPALMILAADDWAYPTSFHRRGQRDPCPVAHAGRCLAVTVEPGNGCR